MLTKPPPSISFDDFVRLEGMGLADGDTAKCTCPLCNSHNKFYITRVDAGLVYNCFKADCPLKGIVRSKSTSKMFKLRKKYAQTRQGDTYISGYILPDEVKAVLRDNYNIHEHVLNANQVTWNSPYVQFPLFDIIGVVQGVSRKILKETEAHPQINRHYLSLYYTDSAGVYFPRHMEARNSSAIVIVEGWMDALKVACSYPCAALMGTNMSDKAASLLSKYFDTLVLFLDPDTIFKMNLDPQIKIRSKYSGLFKSIEVVTGHDKDPKDLPPKEIKDLLERWNF